MTEKRKPIPPMGPYAPPRPSEAEREEAEPMAVARDKETTDDAFMPTSAPLDSYDPEVALRHAAHPTRFARTRRENRAQEEPPGYSETDERGFRRPETDE
ncbi:MAG TPA: hypothetical protein VHH36_06610 [Candidatus Thermoplasmatota archaeon]|nr:hypothetical protein [Candidatus Thermoplasmatota archaeon]